MLAIDFGHTTVKVALAQTPGGTCRLLQRKGEHDPAIPALFYIPPTGEILVGAAANERGQDDPAGVVRNLKANLLRTNCVLRNRRRIHARDLIAALFVKFREAIQGSSACSDLLDTCVLAIPSSFHRQQVDPLLAAAQLAGFRHVHTCDSAIAVACQWTLQSQTAADSVLVVDMGGGQTEFVLLERTRRSYRVHPDFLPRVTLGADAWEGMLWDLLRKQCAAGDLPGGDSTGSDSAARVDVATRKQLTRAKCLPARQACEPLVLSLGKRTFPIAAELIEQCHAQFLEEALAPLQKIAGSFDDYGLRKTVLLAVGGACALPGWEAHVRSLGWKHPLEIAASPATAAVIAVGSTYNTRLPEYTTASSRPIAAGSAPEPAARSQVQTQAAEEPRFVHCPDIGCQVANPAGRTYCLKCGCPLE